MIKEQNNGYMGTPEISVVVPVYNGESTVLACVESILSQNFASFEAIFVDDGSTDNTFCILSKKALCDGRLKVIRQENGGVMLARRNGVRNASGEYICFVDCDDLLLPRALHLLFACVQKNGSDIVCGNSTYTRSIWREYELNSFEYVSALLEQKADLVVWAKLYKKSLLTEQVFELPSHIKFGEDYIMNVRAGFRAGKVSFIPHTVYRYLPYNPGGATSTFPLTARYAREVYGYIREEVSVNRADKLLHTSMLYYLKYTVWLLIHYKALDVKDEWVRHILKEIAPVSSFRERLYLGLRRTIFFPFLQRMNSAIRSLFKTYRK